MSLEPGLINQRDAILIRQAAESTGIQSKSPDPTHGREVFAMYLVINKTVSESQNTSIQIGRL